MLAWGCTGCKSDPPAETWPTAPPEEQGVDSDALAEVVERIDQQGLPINSLQVVRNGVLILDVYFYPYLGDRPHDIASVTKSVTSTLVGIAVDQGLLALDQGVVASFPELVPMPPSDGRTEIELRHLLTMTSGLDCGRTPGEPELFAMQASDHWVKYALELPMAVSPGTEFAYCSPGSHLLSAMVSKASGSNALEFAKESLFGPLGIRDPTWPEDPQGESHGWGDLQLHPRDMAKIGQLFLNEGTWNGEQVVSKEWVEAATRPFIVVDAEGNGYGYQWWVLAGAFEGFYEANGRGGQAITVWPDKDIVVVNTGGGADARGEVGAALAGALKSDEPLDPNPEAYARLEAAILHAAQPPPAKDVPPLSELAGEVSGKVYRLEPNLLELQCISFHFESSSEVWLQLTVDSGVFDLPVGMDGVPRFSPTGPTGVPVGVLGEWIERTVFAIQYNDVAGPNHLGLRAEFAESADSVELELTDPGELFPPQTVPGTYATTCN